MTNKPKTKTTFMLDAKLYAEFSNVVQEIGLRRDVLLNKWLPIELDYLSRIKANSPMAAGLQKSARLASKSAKKKVVFTLETSVLGKLNAVCKEKGVLRDAFLESYLTYLLKDDENDIGPPLYRILELLENPRTMYGWLPDGNRLMPYEELNVDVRLEKNQR